MRVEYSALVNLWENAEISEQCLWLCTFYSSLVVISVGSPQVTQPSSFIAIESRYDAVSTFGKMLERRKISGNAIYVPTESFLEIEILMRSEESILTTTLRNREAKREMQTSAPQISPYQPSSTKGSRRAVPVSFQCCSVHTRPSITTSYK